jgi:hypothetical protein
MDSPFCHRCDKVETMEHLLYPCSNYSEKLRLEKDKLVDTCLHTY